MTNTVKFVIQPQPDDTTCGPTCLHGVYNYYGDQRDLSKIVQEVKALKTGGTLAVMLGIHSLKRGYKAKLYSYNLKIFDPTWERLDMSQLMEKLQLKLKQKLTAKMRLAIKHYHEFLRLGGKILFDELSPELITGFLKKGNPVLTGLSSTHLYRTMREYGSDSIEDDIRGEPQGHFVVLYDYILSANSVMLADPWKKNPLAKSLYYRIPMQRLLNAILLGVLTYDGNLLIIKPGR